VRVRDLVISYEYKTGQKMKRPLSSRDYFVYMMTNKYNNVLYIGVTGDLTKRVAEHKKHMLGKFTAKYNCEKLVYFEIFHNPNDAIYREKQLKEWNREWKNNLINAQNPDWNDLWDGVF